MNQFENLREPIALALPAGLGLEFQADMEHLVDSLFAGFPVEVSSVEQALGLLSGKPPAAVNRIAVARLRAMAEWGERE